MLEGQQVGLPRLLRELSATVQDTGALVGAAARMLSDDRMEGQLLDLQRDLGRLSATLARLAEGLEAAGD